MPKNKNKQPDKMNGKSKDVWSEKLNKLQQQFPEVLSESKVDCSQLKKFVGDKNVAEGERYQFSWAGKSKVLQEIKRRTTKTLKPKRDESVNFDDTDNIFIEGENLEVLKILQKSYYGKVKMIYIDPPYNTGNDFVYNDNFKRSREEEEKESGNLDEEGNLKKGLVKNTKTGRYHSNWLNMMYPRLYLARNLLKEDGVIFVSIDDNEVHNLRMIMNEIFGEENFVAQIIWQKKYSPQNDATYFSEMHDYILCYAKSNIKNNENGWRRKLLPRTEEQNKRYTNPDDDPRGPWKAADMSVKRVTEKDIYKIKTPSGRVVTPPEGRSWVFSKEKFKEMKEDNRIWFGKDGSNMPAVKKFLSEVQEGIVPSTIWFREEAGDNQEARQETKDIFDDKAYFDTPKPVRLMQRILSISTENKKDDIVLDFFAGSGSLAHAVMEQNAEDGGNRKYVMVQLPEEVNEDSEARKADYENIADIAKERIRRASKKINESDKDKFDFDKNELDLGFKSFKLSNSNFKQWIREEVKDEDKLQQKLEDVIENLDEKANKENILFELMLKLGINPNVEIESKQDRFVVKEGEYVICLEDKITKDIIGKILEEEPHVVVCLDNAFDGNDELKTNIALQMKSKDIEFKVI